MLVAREDERDTDVPVFSCTALLGLSHRDSCFGRIHYTGILGHSDCLANAAYEYKTIANTAVLQLRHAFVKVSKSFFPEALHVYSPWILFWEILYYCLRDTRNRCLFLRHFRISKQN